MVESFDSIIKNDTTGENINLIFTDMNQRVETYNYISEKYNVEITNSIGNNLEIGAKGCSKGEALEFLAGLLGITMAEDVYKRQTIERKIAFLITEKLFAILKIRSAKKIQIPSSLTTELLMWNQSGIMGENLPE